MGLLLLRLGVGIVLIYLGASSQGISGLLGATGTPTAIAQGLIEAGGGILLLVGLWTPVVGALVAVDELWIALSLNPSNHIFLAVLATSIAMVGPGAWSIDARLFGRKRFRMADRGQGKR